MTIYPTNYPLAAIVIVGYVIFLAIIAIACFKRWQGREDKEDEHSEPTFK